MKHDDMTYRLKRNASLRETRKLRHAAGRCIQCADGRTDPRGRMLCDPCAAKQLARSKAWRKENGR